MGGGRRLVVLKLKSVVLKGQKYWYGFLIFYQVRKHCCGARKYKWALEMQAETVLLKKKTPAAGVVLSSDCWICSCVFDYLNSHNYVEKKLVLLRTSTPVATWTLSSWSDFRNNLHRVCYFSVWYFVVSVSVNASLWFDIVKCRCRQCTRTNLFTNHWLPQKLKLWCVRLSNDLTPNLSYCGFGYPNHYSTTAVFWSISQGIEMWTQTLPASEHWYELKKNNTE